MRSKGKVLPEINKKYVQRGRSSLKLALVVNVIIVLALVVGCAKNVVSQDQAAVVVRESVKGGPKASTTQSFGVGQPTAGGNPAAFLGLLPALNSSLQRASRHKQD